jgi:hypothetical protein
MDPACAYSVEVLVATASLKSVGGAGSSSSKPPGLYCKFCSELLQDHKSTSVSAPKPDLAGDALVEILRQMSKCTDSAGDISSGSAAGRPASSLPASKLDLTKVISPGFSDRESKCPASFSDLTQFVILRDLDSKSLAHLIMSYLPPTVQEIRLLEETFPSVYKFEAGPESPAAVGLWVQNSNPYASWHALESISQLYKIAVALSAKDDSPFASVLPDLNTAISKLSVSFFANVGRARFGQFVAEYMKSRADRQPIGKCRKDASGHVTSNPGWLFDWLKEAICNSSGLWKKRVVSDDRDLADLLLSAVDFDTAAGKFFDLEQLVCQIGFWHVQRPRDGIYTTLADKFLGELFEALDKLYERVIASGANKTLWELCNKQAKLTKFSPSSFASGDLPSSLKSAVERSASLFSEDPPAFKKKAKSAASSVASSNSSKSSRQKKTTKTSTKRSYNDKSDSKVKFAKSSCRVLGCGIAPPRAGQPWCSQHVIKERRAGKQLRD